MCAGRSPKARPQSVFHRVGRWSRRQARSLATALLFVLLTTALGFLLLNPTESKPQRETAKTYPDIEVTTETRGGTGGADTSGRLRRATAHQAHSGGRANARGGAASSPRRISGGYGPLSGTIS